MDLIAAKCPECGADLKIPEGKDVIVCEYCGASVIVKNVIGTGPSVQNYLALANSSLSGHNYKEAYGYFDKVLEHDSTNPDAWFGKAVCAGALTGIHDARFDEMVVSFGNAVKNSPPGKQDDVKKKAAIDINKAVMNLLKKIMSGGELLFNPREGGGFSISIGNTMYDAKQLADQALRAMETAHEWMPENKEISENLDNLRKRIGDFSSKQGPQNFNIPQMSTTIRKVKRSFGFIKFIFFILIIFAGYYFVKNYLIKDKSFNNIVKKIENVQKNENVQKPIPPYSIINVSSQNETACISISTQANSDDDIININKELLENYKSKYKTIYINYFSDNASGSRNTYLQFKHNTNWIIKNAASINLKATMEFGENQSSRFYKYIDGKTVDITQGQN